MNQVLSQIQPELPKHWSKSRPNGSPCFRDSENIPIVNLDAFTNGYDDRQAQKQTARDLADKIFKNGCIGISGHGIDSDLLREAFAMTERLFDLAYAEKMKAPHPDAAVPHRGYSGTGREHVAQKTEAEDRDGKAKKSGYEKLTDFKESYEIGSEENKVNYNIWLPEDVFPGFRAWGLKFYWELHNTAIAILEALMMSLEVSENEKTEARSLCAGHDNQLRLLHYPPICQEQKEKLLESRLGAHTDWSLFTMLFQDEHGGLQFLDRASGDFIDAVPKDSVLYLNIGDMFQRISNGRYPSALHRVVVKATGSPRYSIPPPSDGMIKPLNSCIEKDGKCNL